MNKPYILEPPTKDGAGEHKAYTIQISRIALVWKLACARAEAVVALAELRVCVAGSGVKELSTISTQKLGYGLTHRT